MSEETQKLTLIKSVKAAAMRISVIGSSEQHKYDYYCSCTELWPNFTGRVMGVRNNDSTKEVIIKLGRGCGAPPVDIASILFFAVCTAEEKSEAPRILMFLYASLMKALWAEEAALSEVVARAAILKMRDPA